MNPVLNPIKDARPGHAVPIGLASLPTRCHSAPGILVNHQLRKAIVHFHPALKKDCCEECLKKIRSSWDEFQFNNLIREWVKRIIATRLEQSSSQQSLLNTWHNYIPILSTSMYTSSSQLVSPFSRPHPFAWIFRENQYQLSKTKGAWQIFLEAGP